MSANGVCGHILKKSQPKNQFTKSNHEIEEICFRNVINRNHISFKSSQIRQTVSHLTSNRHNHPVI